MNAEEHMNQKQEEILERFERESVTRHYNQKSVKLFLFCLAVLYSLFHLYITFNPIPELLQRAVHVAGGLCLIYCFYPWRHGGNNSIPLLDWLLAFLSLLTAAYLFYAYEDLMTVRSGLPNNVDIIFAVLTVVLVVEAARRVTGWILPALALLFMLYPFISSMGFMPARLLTRPYDFSDIFGQMYLKTEGIYSTAIGASVTFIFLFILFGAFLAKSGMGQLFNDLALALAGDKQGGPAKVAVISSGFMGSINGTAVANVVGTGTFTIPLMKRVGYSPNFAGAVEASASVGGQILPPIMGASAFIMAETTGVRYSTIAMAAIFPALLYYLGVLAQVHFRAGKRNLRGIPREQLPAIGAVLKTRGHMLLPILLLIYLLMQQMPVAHAAVYTIAFTVVISWLRPETRMGWRDIIGALYDGAIQSLSVMIACAVVGLIIGVVNLTSFGTVMTSYIVTFGAGSLFLTLILTMLASMVLGMGLPSIPAYIITATMAAPALAGFNIPTLLAHFFVFYFGIFANITPPVALAAFAGAGIAGGDPMRTGVQSLRLALAGFMIPFVFIYNPALMMLDTESVAVTARSFPLAFWGDIAQVVFTTAVGVIALGAAIEGYFKSVLPLWQRLLVGAGALGLIIPETISDVIGLTVIFVILILQLQQKSALSA